MNRDQRLDFWRGLCLVDMVLVHLAFARLAFPWAFTEIFSEYTRFAAGGFVFIAGCGVGLIFLPKAAGAWRARLGVYKRLWRRAGFLLLIHYLTAVVFLWLDVAWGVTPKPDALSHAGYGILTFKILPHYGDILPLYVVLLSVTPVLNELARCLGWLFVAAGSMALVAVGQAHPWMLSMHAGENFPPGLWQVFFIAGLVFGLGLPAYRRVTPAKKLLLCVLSWAAFAAVFLSAWGPGLGVVRTAPLAVVFRKVPLSLGEIYWYLTFMLTIILTTDLVWERLLAGRAGVRFVARLGRRSLPVYVGHVFAQSVIFELIWRLGLRRDGQMTLVVLDIAALWGLAWVRDQGWEGMRQGYRLVASWLAGWPVTVGRRWAPVAVTAVASLSLFVGLAHVALGPHEDRLLLAAGLHSPAYRDWFRTVDWQMREPSRPLVWAAATSLQTFGAHEFALRLPLTLLGVLALWLLALIGTRVFGRWQGALGAVFLASFFPFRTAAGWSADQGMLGLVLLLAAVACWTAHSRSPIWRWLAALLCIATTVWDPRFGLATLIAVAAVAAIISDGWSRPQRWLAPLAGVLAVPAWVAAPLLFHHTGTMLHRVAPLWPVALLIPLVVVRRRSIPGGQLLVWAFLASWPALLSRGTASDLLALPAWALVAGCVVASFWQLEGRGLRVARWALAGVLLVSVLGAWRADYALRRTLSGDGPLWRDAGAAIRAAARVDDAVESTATEPRLIFYSRRAVLPAGVVTENACPRFRLVWLAEWPASYLETPPADAPAMEQSAFALEGPLDARHCMPQARDVIFQTSPALDVPQSG